MLARYHMVRGRRPSGEPPPEGIRQDTRKHTRHCLRPPGDAVERYLADPGEESWKEFRATYLATLEERRAADPTPFALIDLEGPEKEAENRIWRAELYARSGDMRSARRDDEIALTHKDWKKLGRRDRLNTLVRLAIARRAAGEATAASQAAAMARKLAKSKERRRLEALLRANGIR